MKKTLLSLFLLGSLLAASNLILNPTFEQGVSTPLPRDWHPSKGADFEMTEIDGKPALTLSKTGDKEQTPYWIQHNKTLQKGVEYQLVKGETGIQGSIYAECNQPWKTFAKKFTCDGQWQRVVLSFRFKELNHAPYYVVRLSSLGKIAFTEPSLTEVDGQFHNGSFEQGESHWTLENATLPPRKEGGKSLKLDSRQKRSCAIQQGIRLRGGQVYRLSYSVCGGSDRQYTDSQGATWYRVAVLLKGKPLGNTGTWLDSFSSWQKKSVVFMAKGDYAVDIACEIKNPGMVFFDDLALEPLSSLRPPAPLRLLPPYNFHNARFSTQNTVDELRGVLQVNVEGAHHAVIIFRDGRQELPVSEGEHSFAFPVPVEEGCWPIVAEIFDQSGKSLATAKLDFNVYPKATGSHAVKTA